VRITRQQHLDNIARELERNRLARDEIQLVINRNMDLQRKLRGRGEDLLHAQRSALSMPRDTTFPAPEGWPGAVPDGTVTAPGE
jgi:hypothetical protein